MAATNNFTPSELQFFAWLNQRFPSLYAALHQRLEQTPGLGAAEPSMAAQGTSTTKSWQDVVNSLIQVGQAYIQTDYQKQILKANIDRANRNLPPIDVPGMQVGADSATRKTLYYIAAGFGAVWLLPQLLKAHGARRRK